MSHIVWLIRSRGRNNWVHLSILAENPLKGSPNVTNVITYKGIIGFKELIDMEGL